MQHDRSAHAHQSLYGMLIAPWTQGPSNRVFWGGACAMLVVICLNEWSVGVRGYLAWW